MSVFCLQIPTTDIADPTDSSRTCVLEAYSGHCEGVLFIGSGFLFLLDYLLAPLN